MYMCRHPLIHCVFPNYASSTKKKNDVIQIFLYFLNLRHFIQIITCIKPLHKESTGSTPLVCNHSCFQSPSDLLLHAPWGVNIRGSISIVQAAFILLYVSRKTNVDPASIPETGWNIKTYSQPHKCVNRQTKAWAIISRNRYLWSRNLYVIPWKHLQMFSSEKAQHRFVILDNTININLDKNCKIYSSQCSEYLFFPPVRCAGVRTTHPGVDTVDCEPRIAPSSSSFIYRPFHHEFVSEGFEERENANLSRSPSSQSFTRQSEVL